MVLLHPGGEEEGAHNEEPADQEEVEEEGEEREDEGAGDVSDGLAGLAYHVRRHGDPLEAAAEEEREKAGQEAEGQGETEPEILTAGDGLGDSLQAGEEDVLLLASPAHHRPVLAEGEAGQAS